MPLRKRFSRLVLILTLLFSLAGMFSPRPQPVEAKPLGAPATTVVISEFRFRGDGGGDDEFIELYNPISSAVDISGWLIRGTNTSGSSSTRATIPTNTILLPGQYYLVAHNNYTGPTSANLSYGTGIVDDGGVALTLSNGTTIIDQVGITNCVGCYFESSTLNSLGSTATSNIDRGYERKSGGVMDSCQDNNVNSEDFELISTSNPQNLSTPRRLCGNNFTADLSLSQSVSNTTTGSGTIFTVTLTNNGPDDATGVVIQYSLSGDATYEVPYSASAGTYDSGTGRWTIGSLANGASATLMIAARIGLLGGTSTATVLLVNESNPDTSGNNTSTVSISSPQTGSANLRITKTVNNSSPNINDNVVFTVTLTNLGVDNATNVHVKDVLSAGLSYVSDDGGGTYNSVLGIWQVGALPSNSSKVLKITAKVLPSGPYQNTASVFSLSQIDPDLSNNTASVTVTPGGGVADLSLTHTVTKSSTVAGQVDFLLTITNNGPYNATNVILRNKLPSGFTYVSDNSGGTYNKDTGLWPAGAISKDAPNNSKTLRITARVDPTGTLTNYAEIWSADQSPSSNDRVYGNNSNGEPDDASVTVQSADLSITKSMDNVNPAPGTDVVFTININNAGPNTATNVLVKDVLPSNYTYVSDDSGGLYNSSTSGPNAGIWNVGSLSTGQTKTLRITATLVSSSIAVNWAEVWASDQVDIDSVPGNNSRNTDDDASAPFADLRLEKAVSSVNPGANTNFTFTIRVTNDGTVGTTGIQVRDKLPSGVSFVSYTTIPAGSTYNSNTGIWTVGSLATGASATLNIVAKINNSGVYTNVAEVLTSDLPDPDSTPNNGSTIEDDDDRAIVYFRPVLINEVAWAGTSAALPDDQWIELYNPSTVAVNLSGWTLRSSSGGVNINLSGSIPAGGYFLLERNDNSVVSDVNANQIYSGTLLASGETLTLRDDTNSIIDTANQQGSGGSSNPWPGGRNSGNYPSMERQGNTAEQDSVWVTNTGSLRNGTNRRGSLIYGTPGGKNSTGTSVTPTATAVPTRIVIPPRPIINEILARPGFDWNQDGAVDVFDEFIEIKNLTAIDISLNGWRLNTVDGSSFSLPAVTLRPNERIVFYGKDTNILLSDGGETVRLVDSSGKIYDAFTYELAREEDKSFCRLPDGAPGNTWYEDCIPTPNLGNTREGRAPTSPDDAASPVCNLPDTLPLDFLIPECNGYGGYIWNPFYWDFTNWTDKLWIPQSAEKWRSFIE